MTFGKIFLYNCKFSDGSVRTWQIGAESHEEADTKLEDYIQHCYDRGLPVPISVEDAGDNGTMILY